MPKPGKVHLCVEPQLNGEAKESKPREATTCKVSEQQGRGAYKGNIASQGVT